MALDLRPDRTTELFGGGGGGGSDHGGLSGLGDDDHTQYVHTATARTITAVHTFSPVASSAPFTLGANAIDQLVSGLNADQLDGNEATAFATASHNHAASDINSGQLALARGGTNADLSATGGSGQVLKQSSAGASITVAALAASDIPSLAASKVTSGEFADARISAKVRRHQLTIVIDSPATGDYLNIPIPWTCTPKRLEGITDTGTCTYNIEEASSVGGAGTDLLSADQVADATGEIATSFSNTTLTEGNYLIVAVTSVASTPGQVEIHLEVEIDT